MFRPKPPSLRRTRSEAGSLAASSATPSSATPSDEKPREQKSAAYRDSRYETILATKNSIMDTSEGGISAISEAQCKELLKTEQPVPQESLFRDDIFESTCRKIRRRNEARVVRDILPLIVPSAESLATYGARELDILIECTNEGWNSCIPLTPLRPQPDFSLGFRKEAFTEQQYEKLSPHIGNISAGGQSFFMATYQIYFPFLTCEVKCGNAALDVADRQNAHSMTLAVRAIVELFRLVKREAEVNREILAFSVSHDNRLVRIYGHYAVIEGNKTTFYRHPIHEFSFVALDGKDKWTSYKFTKNVYETWMPTHFKRICSAIDDLPAKLDFDVPPLPDSGISSAASNPVAGSIADSASQTGDGDGQVIRGITPVFSFTQPETKRSKIQSEE